MCRSSAGSARRRSVPEGAERRRTGWGRSSIVLVFEELVASWEFMFEFDIVRMGRSRG
jgi:hypothetical protein